MKKILFLLCIFVSINDCNYYLCIGFVNDSDLKFEIGSEETVKLFQSFDSAWKNLDYKLMKSMIADSASFEFNDGKIANSADAFIKIIQEDVKRNSEEGNNYSWTTDYAFPVNIENSKKGEWVNAGFTADLDSILDGVTKRIYNDWYFFNENKKLELWYQNIRVVKEK